MKQEKLDFSIPPHHYIASRIGEGSVTGKSRADVGREVGVAANVVSMIATGKMPLPFKRVAKFAKALECDPVYLGRLTANESEREFIDMVLEVTNSRPVTQFEYELVEWIRAQSGNLDIAWTSRPEFIEALSSAIAAVKKREVKVVQTALKEAHEKDARRAPLKAVKKSA